MKAICPPAQTDTNGNFLTSLKNASVRVEERERFSNYTAVVMTSTDTKFPEAAYYSSDEVSLK